jgi:hypothetical protein
VFSIAPRLNPRYFAQSPPLLTYLGGLKGGKALHLFIEISIFWGSHHSFNLFFCFCFCFFWLCANQIGSFEEKKKFHDHDPWLYLLISTTISGLFQKGQEEPANTQLPAFSHTTRSKKERKKRKAKNSCQCIFASFCEQNAITPHPPRGADCYQN